MIPDKKLARSDIVFVAVCALGYAAVTLIIPPYIPLIEPDSGTYLTFSPTRSALYPAFLAVCKVLGLGLVQITWLQLAIFSLALAYLLLVMLRAGFPRFMLALFVAVLAANILYSSFHRSILTESTYFSLSIVALGLWIDYFRTGRVLLLGLAGLSLGLMIGLRPAGLAIIPMHFLAAWVKRSGHAKWLLVVGAIVPLAIGIASERLMYRLAHRAPAQSTAPLLLMGKAAMLIQPEMIFSGPHAGALDELGVRLLTIFAPLHTILANAPSLSVRAQLAAAYEGAAQDGGFMRDELAAAAQRENTSVDELRAELGRQVMLQNVSGYLKETLLMQFGQWSVDAQSFPPTARALAEYAAATPGISLNGRLTPEMLHPKPALRAAVVYPTFLAVGALTLPLAVGFLIVIVRPALVHTPAGFYFGLATFLAALCHGYTLFISLVNIWTPRFLMAVFPHLAIVALCLAMLVLLRWRRQPSINAQQTERGETAE